MTTETTYTVTRQDGTVIDRGLTAHEAMVAILTHDSYDYDIVPEDAGGWILIITSHSKCTSFWRWTKTTIIVDAETLDEATDKIAQRVIAESHNWPGALAAITDADYDESMAEVLAELED